MFHRIKSMAFIILIFLASIANCQTFIVNSVQDNPDINSGDGLCDTGNMVGVDTECTLRAAIQETNLAANISTINFNIFGCLDDICVLSPNRLSLGNYPDFVKPVILDGSSQPGNTEVCTNSIETRNHYRIVLEGDGIAKGMQLDKGSSGSIFKGLNIRNFTDNIRIQNSSNNKIACNFIGTDETGMASSGNNLAIGIVFFCDSQNNIVGGENLEDGNLISGNQVDGVQFFGMDCTPDSNVPTNNAVLGNYIGTNKSTTATINNSFSGITFFSNAEAVHSNYVGRLANGTINGNVIGGNDSGVYLNDGATGIIIQGNYIGTDKTGTFDLGNFFGGVDIISGNNNQVGGILPDQANTIAFNSEGVFISGGATSINNVVRGNSFFNNLSQSIDIILDGGVEPDGLNINDTDDADIGANKFINHPDIISINLIDTTNPATVDVEFMVDATNTNASFPLTIDVYFSLASDTSQGRFYLGSSVYTTPQMIVTETFTLPIGLTAGRLVMSTTDSENNTSEFSFIDVGDVDFLFKDSFE